MRKSRCTTGISTTTAVNFATSFASVVDTGGFIWKQYQAENVAHVSQLGIYFETIPISGAGYRCCLCVAKHYVVYVDSIFCIIN
jgi:hypothetical protein